MRSSRSPPSTRTVARRRMTAGQAREDRRSGAVRRQFHGRRRRQDAGGDRARRGRRGACSFRPASCRAASAATFPVPHVVDVHHDSARHVGDEPLLLAEHAPVAVTPDRAAGARLLLASRGCDFLIMDDGFQSARIHMDYALLVVDARRGVGNGHVIPGGPLRAPLVDQLRFAKALLKMGEGAARRRHRPQGGARRPAGLRGAHRDRDPASSLPAGGFWPSPASAIPSKFFDTVTRGRRRRSSDAQLRRPSFFTRDDLDELAAAAARRRGSDSSPRPRTPCVCGMVLLMSASSLPGSACWRLSLRLTFLEPRARSSTPRSRNGAIAVTGQ